MAVGGIGIGKGKGKRKKWQESLNWRVCEMFSCTNKLSNYAYNWCLFCVTLFFSIFPFIVFIR